MRVPGLRITMWCMRRIMLIIEYDGSAYVGWQVQPNGLSVQQVMENAIRRLTGEDIRVRGASRTDSGVHARGQVAVFDTKSRIPSGKFSAAINSRLPDDVTVRESRQVCASFDPRRHAKCKQYTYRLSNSLARPAIGRKYIWHVKRHLDVARMQEAAGMLVGTHDFTSLANNERRHEENTRTITRSEILARETEITYIVEGRSFLYNMVRNIVGLLVDVGAGRFKPADVPRILATRDRACAGQGAPALGLCLEWIRY